MTKNPITKNKLLLVSLDKSDLGIAGVYNSILTDNKKQESQKALEVFSYSENTRISNKTVSANHKCLHDMFTKTMKDSLLKFNSAKRS